MSLLALKACWVLEESLASCTLQSTRQDLGDMYVPSLSLTWAHCTSFLDPSFFNTNEQIDINWAHKKSLYNSLGGLHFNPHFPDEEAEAQKDRHLGKFSGESV